MERRRERVNKGGMIATTNMSSMGLLARVVLALYVFHVGRDKLHMQLTLLQKVPSHCRKELLQVSSPTNSLNTAECRANERREREAGREGENG